MKIIYVVDSVSELTKKINLLLENFGKNIIFVVRADLVDLFKTYGYNPNVVYYNNLTRLMHQYLISTELNDTIICYASLKFNQTLLLTFTNKLGNKSKIVNLMPKYNSYEQIYNSTYNVYVKSMFKIKDSLISPKLQFIPSSLLPSFLSTHLGNRLFELDDKLTTTVTIENKEINESMKVKNNHLKLNLISTIIGLLITAFLLASIAYFKVKFIVVLICVILYALDIVLTAIFKFKTQFDQRFLK